ncbi:hypothetical protein [Candidatus Nitrosocosmicus hydrocola]|nr:hypothetical protein [Candidatus Nitrosocosmicus hydrocola]
MNKDNKRKKIINISIRSSHGEPSHAFVRISKMDKRERLCDPLTFST